MCTDYFSFIYEYTDVVLHVICKIYMIDRVADFPYKIYLYLSNISSFTMCTLTVDDLVGTLCPNQ